MSNIQTYKFIFSAEIGTFNMKAKVSSPLFVTWKRSIIYYSLQVNKAQNHKLSK